mmetsp:Transcript_9567/g.27546  ORF Transcript_9567/g.27546 Transcript_9567/m.27546 type:complete len:219 (-) Transcript_9567:344-1000(-)
MQTSQALLSTRAPNFMFSLCRGALVRNLMYISNRPCLGLKSPDKSLVSETQGTMNVRTFAMGAPNNKMTAQAMSRMVPTQQYISSPGTTADPPPLPSAPPRSFFNRVMSSLKTWSALRHLSNASPSLGFSSAQFPVEAERIVSSMICAIENGDKSELRDLVTEHFYSKVKRNLPDKKRGAPKVTVATAGAKIVQARRIQLTRYFTSNVCELRVLFVSC